MIYLILAVLSSAGVAVVMRLSVNHVKNDISMLSASYLSCAVLAAVYAKSGIDSFQADELLSTVILGIIAGAVFLAGFVFLQLNTRINGVVLSAIFSRLGVIVPALISVTLFKEQPEIVQIIGFVLAVIAIVMINWGKSEGKAKSAIALIMLLLCCGLADSMAKFFDEYGDRSLEDFYYILTFAVAFVLSAVLALGKKQKLCIADVLYGFVLGIPNYYSVRFLTKAVSQIPAFITFPTYSVASIVVISIAGMVFFKEKLSKNQKYGIGIILLALVLLNI